MSDSHQPDKLFHPLERTKEGVERNQIFCLQHFSSLEECGSPIVYGSRQIQGEKRLPFIVLLSGEILARWPKGDSGWAWVSLDVCDKPVSLGLVLGIHSFFLPTNRDLGPTVYWA